jgi:dTDP-4-amino-4,6-dideoxygalactose transaminase
LSLGRVEVPFLDLVTPHLELEEELVAVFRNAVRTAGFIGGPIVEHFEREFAACCGARHAVGVSSGTDALRFALMSAGVQSGDTVVTVPNTFVATTEAILQAGGRPEFVDIDDLTYTMDPQSLRKYLEAECTRDSRTGRVVSRRTFSPVTAVIAVHLYGQMADMDRILALAAEYNLVVVEDACQAHGAEYFSQREQRWRPAGSMGRAAAFSFYPGKNLGACGEAGAVTTDDEQVARRCQMLRDHGQSKKYFHDLPGYNGRLDAIQAGVLRVKLPHLAAWNQQRRACADLYRELLCDGVAILPYTPRWSRPVYHLYVVRVANRDRVQSQLAAAGIGTGIHYPVPLSLAKAHECLFYRQGDFPNAERAASEILSLPMFPGLSGESQRRVVHELHRATASRWMRSRAVGSPADVAAKRTQRPSVTQPVLENQ